MSKHERKAPPVFSNFGFSTILLAFVMICIITISALALLTANSDYKLSQKVAEKNSSFYEAEKQANYILSNVDQELAKAYYNSTNDNSYYEDVERSMKQFKQGTYDKNTCVFSYTVPITDNHELYIELLVLYPESTEESLFEIITWKSVYNIDTPEEGTLNLID